MAPSLSLQMSQIIAHDAPLLSPSDAGWHFSPTEPCFAYALPPSPPLSDDAHHPSPPPPIQPVLRMRQDPSPDDRCVPTNQLFDLPEEDHDQSPPPPPSSCGTKRSASPAPSAAKKRAVGERISSKDFVPPDVSGLSKREARLVKNRAAAFLSRQRKREEFECMEVRVAELEQENARLLALTASSTAPGDEVEQLRAQLAAARERERTLSAQLASSTHPAVKQEATDDAFLPARNSLPPHKSGASLGLMVLLCALPSLLMQSAAAQTSFAIPNPFPPAFDYASYLPHDWTNPVAPSRVRKLQFTGTEDLGPLADLDISFESSPADDGRIRVRIHPPSEDNSSRAPSPAYDLASMGLWDTPPVDPFLGPPPASHDFGLPFAADGSLRYDYAPSFEFASSSSHTPYPFSYPASAYATHTPGGGGGSASPMSLSAGSSSPTALEFGHEAMTLGSTQSHVGFNSLSGAEYSVPDASGAKRRVRIALKSMPRAGGAEGGEWEVQIC